VEAGTTKGNVEGEETERKYTRPYLLVSMFAPVDQEGGVAKGVQTIIKSSLRWVATRRGLRGRTISYQPNEEIQVGGLDLPCPVGGLKMVISTRLDVARLRCARTRRDDRLVCSNGFQRLRASVTTVLYRSLMAVCRFHLNLRCQDAPSSHICRLVIAEMTVA
jgi:hypothetical protein